MSDKALIYIGAAIGGTIGGFVPGLWHAGVLSGWGILFEGIGGLVGIWLAYQLVHS